MRLRARLNRYHIWLGWLIGVPLLFWTVSGLFMAGFPIEAVRGTALKSGPAILTNGPYVMPQDIPSDVIAMAIEQQAAGPRWILESAGGTIMRADARTGAAVPPVDASEARAIAGYVYSGEAHPVGVTAFAANANPLDIRSGKPVWQIRYDDGTHLYIDRNSGRLLAVRTRLWRAYDWMWGLHIMDLQDRENSHHALLYGFGGLALAGVVLGLILLPMTGKRRAGKKPRP